MTRQELINKVKAIIIDSATPSRVWLYGSEASAEASQQSDIDLAYWRDKDENSYDKLSEIKNQIETLDTLIKVDVSDLSMCEERFLNRVKSTGKVIFSASKELRAEDALFNYVRAVSRLSEALECYHEYPEDSVLKEIFIDVLVKRFEFSFEMCWKAIKRMLAYKGITEQSPRGCLKEAFQQGWIENEHIVLSMLEMRNTTAHTDDLSAAKEILDLAPKYLKEFQHIYQQLENALEYSSTL